MPISSNKRIYYGCTQAGIRDVAAASYNAIHGLQSIGMTTNFNLQQIFEIGQIAVYANLEDLPDVDASLSKCLDGYPLIYHLATAGTTTTSPSLAGRSNSKCIFSMAVFSDTSNSANGTPISQIEMSGMFVASVGYNFPLDAPYTEDVRLVGNNKIWANDPKATGVAIGTVFTGAFTTNTDAPLGTNTVQRRESMLFTKTSGLGVDSNSMYADPNCTILPPEVFGISASGTNEKSNGTDFDAHVAEIRVSTDLGRESINEQGRRGPYHRFATFPVEVSCDITVTSTSGDMISAVEAGIYAPTNAACGVGSNLRDRTIRIAVCEGTRIYLGMKNKLDGVDHNGGDATGGNVSVTYRFKTYNDFTVIHSGDPHASGSTWWTNRSTYLTN